jgi:hypothetical protein
MYKGCTTTPKPLKKRVKRKQLYWFSKEISTEIQEKIDTLTEVQVKTAK